MASPRESPLTASFDAAEAPLVSFIMPAWNPNPEWLRQAVASVLTEEWTKLELIVVDDGSNSLVRDLLSDVEDPRLRILPDAHEFPPAHTGVSAARNTGLQAAKGSLVRYVDCDDAIVPGSTRHLLRLRKGDPSDRLITFGGMTYCDPELRPRWSLGCQLDKAMFEPVMRGRLDAYVPCLLIPRTLLETTGPWDESMRLCEDLDFMFRLSEHADIRGDETPVYLYRRHPEAASVKGRPGGEDPWLVVHSRYFARHPEHVGTKVERWLNAAYTMDQAVQRWDSRSPLQFVRMVMRAAWLSPGDAWHHARAEVKYRRLQRRTGRYDSW